MTATTWLSATICFAVAGTCIGVAAVRWGREPRNAAVLGTLGVVYAGIMVLFILSD